MHTEDKVNAIYTRLGFLTEGDKKKVRRKHAPGYSPGTVS